MQHTGGRWIVAIVGAIIVVCGAVLVWEGIKHKFEKYFEPDRMTATQRRVVKVMGMVGTAARGVVFALAGVFVIVAAVKANPRKAGGLDQALRELLGIPAGAFLVVLAGIGLVIFGLYGYTEAKWRKTG